MSHLLLRTLLFLSPLFLMPILVWPDGLHREEPTPKLDPSHLPKFKVHDCFHRDGLREPWEGTLPDGIIEMKGYEHYLVMFREEAERRGGQPKWAQTIGIKSFDARHHHIDCPESWRNHGKKK